MGGYPFIFGSNPYTYSRYRTNAIRYDYTPGVFYIGFGAPGATDSTIITIKRVTVDLSDGSVVEEYSTNPWTNFADGPWSPTP